MRVLVACEFSGIVREAFIARGHDAWSCDLLPSEDGGRHMNPYTRKATPMAINAPISDTSRAIQHDSDESYPESVKIQILWRDKNGRPIVRTEHISAAQFFGTGSFGAPLSGDWLISFIARMVRSGPPKPVRRGKR